MPLAINIVLILFLTILFVWGIVELIISRVGFRDLIQIGIPAGMLVLLLSITDFPAVRVAFGGFSPLTAIVIMFVCVCAGIAANHFFYSKKKFSVKVFFKTILISPILLLPLIGSVQGISALEAIQLISFGILAFQNGFFWKEVLEHARMQQ